MLHAGQKFVLISFRRDRRDMEQCWREHMSQGLKRRTPDNGGFFFGLTLKPTKRGSPPQKKEE